MTESPRNTQRPAPWAPPNTPASPAPAPTLAAAPRQRPNPTARTLPTRAAQGSTRGPGHASKIITAGLSTSLVLGMVSYFGNAAQAQAHQAVVPAVQAPTVIPAVTATPQVITVNVPGAPPPVAATPQAAPIPAPAPAPAPAPTTSGTTKASG
ncbi:MAG: hypothetical protein K8R99_06415 [Actinomycetia bacterium]|nr:hypothetical protein [Actinomycetes bacterium]